MQKEMKKYPYYKYSDVNASPVRKLYRHLGGELALKLKDTKITPNQITYLSFLFSILASILILKISFVFSVLAALALFISVVLDKADGSLARIRKVSTTFGNWLDAASDNLSILILMVAITYHAFVKTGNDLYLVAGVLTITGFQTGKVVYMTFKRTNKDASKVISAAKKHKFMSIMYFNEYFIWNSSVIFMLFYRIEWLLAFMAFYSWFFYFAMLSIFTLKSKKSDRKMTAKEALTGE